MITPGKGKLLIANPFLQDPNFIRTVIFLCEHQGEGSFGFVVNKLFPQTLDELLTDLDGYKVPVYYGGPVQRDTIHFLHQMPELIPDGQRIFDNTYWGGNFESLVVNIKNNNIDFDKIKFFIGYSGWSEGQLDKEMEEKTWIAAEGAENLIFHTDPDEIWKDSLKQLGGEYEMMINFPIDPQLN